MKHPRFLLALACAAANFTCISSSDEPDTDEPAADPGPAVPEPEPIARWDGGGDAPGEVIHVEGDAPPGSQGGAPWGPGHGGPNPSPDNGGGGGGRPGNYEPVRKDCMKEVDNDACHQCCDYNADVVDARQCKKMPLKDGKRRKCLEKAQKDRQKCHEECGQVHIYPADGVSQ